jgi:hypothetical protein
MTTFHTNTVTPARRRMIEALATARTRVTRLIGSLPSRLVPTAPDGRKELDKAARRAAARARVDDLLR